MIYDFLEKKKPSILSLKGMVLKAGHLSEVLTGGDPTHSLVRGEEPHPNPQRLTVLRGHHHGLCKIICQSIRIMPGLGACHTACDALLHLPGGLPGL